MTRDGPSVRAPLHFDPRRRVIVPWDRSSGEDSVPAPARQCKATMRHAGCRLFQQYCVDVFTRIEGERLDWRCRNQPLLRCETLQGLADYLEKGASARVVSAVSAHQPCPEASNVVDPDFSSSAVNALRSKQDVDAESACPASGPDRPVILPASYSGSPRELRQCYLNAMAMVQRHGKPDLFMTMTANPSWPEIVAHLWPGETAANRPNLTSRIFRLKLRALMQDLIKGGVMGRVVTHTWAVEFQKRGLPHAHILIILQGGDKPRTPADVDCLVCAELPDPATQAELYAAVCKHMRHGPCGPANPPCPCTDSNTKMCSRSFPREYQDATLFNLGGHPLYRRRRLQNGATEARTTGRPYEQMNRRIVPYIPYLLLRFDCHLNIEVCTSIKAAKYLYKYIHKGPDRASIQMAGAVDGITLHLDARHVAAPEATWRIFRYPLHDQSHAVVRLPLHLPRGQVVHFEQGQEVEAYRKALAKPTKLEAYFALNQARLSLTGSTHASRAEPLLYQDTLLKYIWRDGEWLERQHSCYTDCMIGRVYAVSAKEGERYYLRVLLQHLCDATCFEDLRVKRGMDLAPLEPILHHNTFQQAALSSGLLDDGALAPETLDEAVTVTAASPAHLRRIFVMVLEWLPVPDAAASFGQYKEDLGADYSRSGSRLEAASDKALHDIHALLRERGLHPDSFNLPEPAAKGRTDWGTLACVRP